MTHSSIPCLLAAASLTLAGQTAQGLAKALPPQTAPPQAQLNRVPAFLPVNLFLKPMTLTGLLGAGASFQPLTVQVKPLALMGLGGPGPAFTPVSLASKPFTLTGLRP